MKNKSLLILLFLGTTFLSSCVVDDSSSYKWNKTRSEELSNIFNAKMVQIDESLVVNHNVVSKKTGSYYVSENTIYGYSETFNINSNFFNSGYGTVNKYVKGNKYAVSANGTTKEYEYTGTTIYDYLGLFSIFINGTINRKFNSSVNYKAVENIIDSLKEDSGNNANINESSVEENYQYTFKFDNEDKLLSLEIDVTSVVDYLFSNTKKAYKKYTFKVLDSLPSIPSYPSSNGGTNTGNNNDKIDVNTLKQMAENYIDDLYKDFKYISESITFTKVCPLSSRIKFSYSTSNSSILDNLGNFVAPSQDTEISLYVNILIDQSTVSTKEYKLTAHKPVVRNSTATIGSKDNPIYQGREEIDKVEIYFIEMVDQYGDSIYIKAGDFDMLIDAGQTSDGYNVLNFLKQHVADSRLDMVVTTHAHSDHIGGMPTVLDWSKYVTYAMDYGYDRQDYATSIAVRNLLKNKAEKYIAVTDALNENNGLIWISNDFYIDVLNTGSYIKPGVDINGGDDNAASVAFIMHYKEHKYYFSGDLESSGESYMVNTNQLQDVNLMKASHHGTPNGNSSKLLNKIKPEIVVVSTALINHGNGYTNARDQVHPSQKALNNFYNVNAKVYCNFTNGTVKITSTGSGSLSVQGLGVISPYYMNGRTVSGEDNKEFRNTAWGQAYRY